MTINFPNTLDTLTNPSASSDTAAVSHAGQHSDINDAIEALEAKVGTNSSSVVTSLDYIIKNTASINPGHKHTVANLSDTTITTPTNGQALVYDTATSKWINSTVASADASTTVKGSSKLSTTPVSAVDPISVGDNDTRMPSQSENDAMQGTSGTPSNTNRYVTNDDTATSGANKVLRLNGSGALPAVSGANLTSLPSTLVSKTSSDSRIMTLPSGTQVITHGLGVIPKVVRISFSTASTNGSPNNSVGSGYYDGTSNFCNYMAFGTSGQATGGGTSASIVYALIGSGGVAQTASITAVSGTTFTLNWVSPGGTNGTCYFTWEVSA